MSVRDETRAVRAACLFALALGAGCRDDEAAAKVVVPDGGVEDASGDGPAAARACDLRFVDCDGKAKNGCEVDLFTDPRHCGTCDRSCGECRAGACEVVTSFAITGERAADLVLTPRQAFFTVETSREAGQATRRVHAIDLSSGMEAVLEGELHDDVLEDEGGRGLLAGDDEAMFAVSPRDGVLFRAGTSALSPFAESLGPVGAVATTTDRLILVRGSTSGGGGDPRADGAVLSLSRDGGEKAVIAEGLTTRTRCRITADGAHVYWTDTGAKVVLRLPLQGGEPETYAFDQRLVCGVRRAGEDVLWAATDPTLSVRLMRNDASSVADPDAWKVKASPVGTYAPGHPAWDFATTDRLAVFANGHEGVLRVIELSTEVSSVLAAGQVLRTVALRGGRIAWIAEGALHVIDHGDGAF
jgi:hypothetical protein